VKILSEAYRKNFIFSSAHDNCSFAITSFSWLSSSYNWFPVEIVVQTVTVRGVANQTISLSYDVTANANLAQKIAAAISAGVTAGTVTPYQVSPWSGKGSTPPAPPVITKGTGEFIQAVNGASLLPAKYDDVIVSAASATISGNGDAGVQVLVGAGNLSFLASTISGGSGTIVGGGGNNYVSLPAPDLGSWLIDLGNGANTVVASNRGNDTINVGSGVNKITLGAGQDLVTTQGSGTIYGGSGSATISASATNCPPTSLVVQGGSGNLLFLASNNATVFGGTGSVSVTGGSGTEVIYGGAAGSNSLQAGTGAVSLFGAGNGDQLFAAGSQAQLLVAGNGNETLNGSGASGADTFVGGAGTDHIIGNTKNDTFELGKGTELIQAFGTAANVFEFVASTAGGAATVTGLTSSSQIQIVLSGYGPKNTVSQAVSGGNLTVSLSDGSKITFLDVGSTIATNHIKT